MLDLRACAAGAYNARMHRRWLAAVAGLGSFVMLQCGGEHSPPPRPTASAVARSPAPAEQPRDPARCARWTGGTVPESRAAEKLDGPSPIAAVVDLDAGHGPEIRQELQALVDADFPDFAGCGLRPADLRSLRLVVDPSSGVQGRIVGLPSLEKLRACPPLPDLVALAEARGWILEDERPGTLRARRRRTARLPDEAFEFAAPAERWLHVRATAGPPTRSVTVTLEDSDEHGMQLRIDAPADVIAAAGSWCDRARQRQESPRAPLIHDCLTPSPTTLQILPSSQESSDFVALQAAMRSELFETFEVHGNSMLPTVRDGDVVFVDKLERGKVPARGDIVLFDGGEGVKLVKRVIALPGEELELSAEGLRIDGRALRSSPTRDTEAASSCAVRLLAQHLDGSRFDFIADTKTDTVTVRVPVDHVFVLGDNRPVSKDSRAFGPVDVRAIDGVARFIAWSVVGERFDWERSTTSLYAAPCSASPSATTDPRDAIACPDEEQAIR